MEYVASSEVHVFGVLLFDEVAKVLEYTVYLELLRTTNFSNHFPSDLLYLLARVISCFN